MAWVSGSPCHSLARVGLEPGSAVELHRRDRHIVIEPLPSPPTLDQLLAGTSQKLWAQWTPGRGDIVSQRVAAGGTEHSLVLSPAPYSARLGFALVCPIGETSGPFAIDLPRGLPVQARFSRIGW